MGIVRLLERKSTSCHEAKALGEEEVSDPAVLDTPMQRKKPTRMDALKATPAHPDERVPGGCKHPTAD